MLFWYRRTSLRIDDDSCNSISFTGREVFLKWMQSYLTSNYQSSYRVKYQVVPASCVKRLFPGVVWRDSMIVPWPKGK